MNYASYQNSKGSQKWRLGSLTLPGNSYGLFSRTSLVGHSAKGLTYHVYGDLFANTGGALHGKQTNGTDQLSLVILQVPQKLWHLTL